MEKTLKMWLIVSNLILIATKTCQLCKLRNQVQAVLDLCDATEVTPAPGVIIPGAHVSTTKIRRAITEALA